MTATSAVETLRSADAALADLSPTPFPVPLGNLAAVVAGALTGLGRGDWWVPGLRERVGGVLREVPLERLADGFAGARPYRVAPPTPSAANRALVAVGLAVANPEKATLVHLGIGSVADGGFHEALNLAALQGPTVLFLVAVDPLREGAPLAQQTAARPSELAAAHGLATTVVDGRDPEAVAAAVIAAKKAGGPHLIEATLG